MKGMYEINLVFADGKFDWDLMQKILFVIRSFIEPADRNNVQVLGKDNGSRIIRFNMVAVCFLPLAFKLRRIISEYSGNVEGDIVRI